MPRSKSIPGSSKSSRSKPSNPQTNAATEPIAQTNSAAGSPASTAPEANADAFAGAVTEHKTQADSTPGNKQIGDPSSESNTSSLSGSHGEGRKLEMVKNEVAKNDSRRNLVPINLEDEIRRRAYEIYEERGSISGNEAEDWLAAEREVRQRYRAQSA